jgi:alpha-tubulin suppressor-like RCC1 family protein
MDQMRTSIVLALLATVLPAQPGGKLPVIAGNHQIYVMVEPDGTVKTWGNPSSDLSIGDGVVKTGIKVDVPQTLPGIRNAVSAAVGEEHALILLADGTVVGWGRNWQCEVGNGNLAKKPRAGDGLPTATTPVAVTGLRNVKQIFAGDEISGAILADGTVRLWGKGTRASSADDVLAAGNDRMSCVPVPRPAEELTGATQLALAPTHALALREDGTVLAWGRNDVGQLGDGTQESRVRPVQVAGITNAVWIAANHNISVAVLADGTVRTWGDNINGHLGDPKTASANPPQRYHLTPFAVPGIAGARSVNAGLGFVIVHLKDGTLRGFGEGYYGGLGNGNYGDWTASPQAPKGLGPVLVHYVAGRRNFAIRADGTVMAWGPIDMMTPAGQKPYSTTPIPVFTASPVRDPIR